MTRGTDGASDVEFAAAMSVLRARAEHWLADHPEPARPTSWEIVVDGFASLLSLFGDVRRWPVEDASTRFARCSALACVGAAEQVAAERGVTLFPISREDLPWWETLVFALTRRARTCP